MASKELFDQPLKTKAAASDRVATGIPGQEGADNLLRGAFFGSIMQYGRNIALTSGQTAISFANDLDSDAYMLMVRTYNGVAWEEVSRDETGFTIDVLADTTIDYLAILF